MPIKVRQRTSAQDSPGANHGDPMLKAGQEIVAGYKLIEDAWKKAEAKLALSHVPVDVRVEVAAECIGPGENPIGHRTTYLGFVKVKNEWRICLVEDDEIFNCHPDDQPGPTCRPITEVPVETRLQMFDSYERLYAKVMEVVTSYVPKIKEKVSKFEATLGAIDD